MLKNYVNNYQWLEKFFILDFPEFCYLAFLLNKLVNFRFALLKRLKSKQIMIRTILIIVRLFNNLF